MTDYRQWPLWCCHVHLHSWLRWAEKIPTLMTTPYIQQRCALSSFLSGHISFFSLFLYFLTISLLYTFLSPLLDSMSFSPHFPDFSCALCFFFLFFINDVLNLCSFLFLYLSFLALPFQVFCIPYIWHHSYHLFFSLWFSFLSIIYYLSIYHLSINLYLSTYLVVKINFSCIRHWYILLILYISSLVPPFWILIMGYSSYIPAYYIQ